MARQVRIEVLADARKYTQGMRDAQRSTQKFADHTSKASGALKAAFATFSAGAVVAGLKSTVDAASAMNETASKTRVVFGPAAKGVEDFARRAATSMGLSRQEAEESAATFGNLFVSMRIGAPRAAEMSTRMVQLAGDLASFNNANPQETLEALRSGLVGETEPLRRFGINLNDADLRQKALSLGLVQTTKNVLPPAVKAQAAYALILEQSKTAQGDFARTSGGLANQQRILAAKIKDLKANIGNALLPTVLKGVSAFNSFLGVIDRNRTAFGVLFGVIATGAGVIGGLLLVERSVKATKEALKVATTAWSAAQKGLNIVLGVTKVQATTTAAAEEALAVKTAAAGTAAQGTAAKMGAAGLLGKVGGLSGALVALSPLLVTVGVGLEALRERSDSATQAADRLAKATDQQIDKAIKTGTVNQVLTGQATANAKATADQGLQTAYAAKQAEAQRQEMVKLVPQYQTAADKARLNADAIKDMSAKLKDARGELAQNRESMAQTIESYQGLVSQSKLTAGEVVKDIRNQVANFKTYARDTQTLIKAGVNPAAIRELSEKGPEYVHALATGSNRQLQEYKRSWRDRQEEVKTSFATAMDKQYQGLVRKIRDMQRQIDSLRGKTIDIKARTNVEITASVRQYLAASNVPGFHQKGTLIPGYGGGDIYPAMLEPGEAVVPKDKAKRPDFRAWANSMRIPGFQFGGLMGRYYNPTVSETRRIGQSMADVASYVIRQFGGSPAIKAFIRSTDPLPYIWGAAGPGGYDCSGLVGAVLGKATGRGGGHGQRYFTTGTIHSGILGIKPGLGGVLQIGVTPSRGHMVGRYGGLGFEAESTRTGIKVGAAASKPESFARRYHLAKGGLIGPMDREALRWLTDQRLAIGGDPGKLRVESFDHGGGLRPGATLALNNTGRTEPVGAHVTNIYVDRTLLAKIVNDGGLRNARLA